VCVGAGTCLTGTCQSHPGRPVQQQQQQQQGQLQHMSRQAHASSTAVRPHNAHCSTRHTMPATHGPHQPWRKSVCLQSRRAMGHVSKQAQHVPSHPITAHHHKKQA
jgi:hypothetical protein